MLISEETRDQLNELVKFSFDANAVVDNYAYNLADKGIFYCVFLLNY